MNAASIMKLMNAKRQFDDNHPKFAAFCKSIFARPLEEGTVVEVTVTRPDGEVVTTNLKVQQSDLELLAELREITG